MPDKTDERTERELIDEAIRAQDACNISGLLRSWVAAVDRLRALGVWDNRHPVNQMWAQKLYDLAGSPDWANILLGHLEPQERKVG